jgi:hypothetical protein
MHGLLGLMGRGAHGGQSTVTVSLLSCTSDVSIRPFSEAHKMDLMRLPTGKGYKTIMDAPGSFVSLGFILLRMVCKLNYGGP